MQNTLTGPCHMPDNPDAPLVLRIEAGQWDVYRIDEFVAQIVPSYEHPNVIFDMSEVEYVDSTVLGAFARKRKIRAAKGWKPSRLVLAPAVRRIFERVHFDEVWPIFETLESALDRAC